MCVIYLTGLKKSDELEQLFEIWKTIVISLIQKLSKINLLEKQGEVTWPLQICQRGPSYHSSIPPLIFSFVMTSMVKRTQALQQGPSRAGERSTTGKQN